MALSREPTMNPQSSRQCSPALFLVLLAAIVVGIGAFMLLRSGTSTTAKPISNGVQQATPTSSK